MIYLSIFRQFCKNLCKCYGALTTRTQTFRSCFWSEIILVIDLGMVLGTDSVCVCFICDCKSARLRAFVTSTKKSCSHKQIISLISLKRSN